MAKQVIRKFGDEVLRTKASVVSKFDKKLEKLTRDMLHTMYAASGVGLAAPQIGVSKRVLTIDTEYANENEDGSVNEKDPLILINPEIVYHEGELESFEGCLSFPNVYFNVRRYSKVVCRYYDLKGKEQRIEANGDLLSRCIQHEIDHLDGQLFVDIATDKIIAQAELTKNGLGQVQSKPKGLII
jgi:peptide deformylase